MKIKTRTLLASTALLACSLPALADVTVSGNYLQLGVNTGGSLIDFGSFTGLKYDPSGTGNFSSPVDVLAPGNPFAFYSIGVNGNWNVAGGGAPTNPFNTTTVDLSAGAGSPFVFTKNGSYGGLAFQQVLSFNQDSKSIHSTVTFQNVSGAQVNNVVYAAGIDPDQDVNTPMSSYWTQNTIQGQGVDASVTGFGPVTGLSVTMRNTTGWVDTTASVSRPWDTNPYILSGPAINDGNGDYTINLAYRLGDFAPGQEKTVGFDYAIAAVPEPETYAMLIGGLGLLGAVARRRSGKHA